MTIKILDLKNWKQKLISVATWNMFSNCVKNIFNLIRWNMILNRFRRWRFNLLTWSATVASALIIHTGEKFSRIACQIAISTNLFKGFGAEFVQRCGIGTLNVCSTGIEVTNRRRVNVGKTNVTKALSIRSTIRICSARTKRTSWKTLASQTSFGTFASGAAIVIPAVRLAKFWRFITGDQFGARFVWSASDAGVSTGVVWVARATLDDSCSHAGNGDDYDFHVGHHDENRLKNFVNNFVELL